MTREQWEQIHYGGWAPIGTLPGPGDDEVFAVPEPMVYAVEGSFEDEWPAVMLPHRLTDTEARQLLGSPAATTASLPAVSDDPPDTRPRRPCLQCGRPAELPDDDYCAQWPNCAPTYPWCGRSRMGDSRGS